MKAMRRFAMANWKTPVDPSVYIHLQADFTNAQFFLDKNNKNQNEFITVIHLVMKSMSLVIKKYPQLNAVILRGNIYLRKTIDIFMNVFIPSDGENKKSDLAGTKIENCDQKSIYEIAHEAKIKTANIRNGNDYNTKRNQKLSMIVSSFIMRCILWLVDFLTIRIGINLERFGVPYDLYGSCLIAGLYKYNCPTMFTALLPYTRWGVILCINNISKKPWVVENEIKSRLVIDIGLTGDHRLLDGAEAAMACNYLKEILENPEKYLN